MRNRTAGRAVPKSSQPDWVVRELAALRAEITELRSARTLEAATIGRGGITINEDGALKVIDSDGHTVGIIGALPVNMNRSDGSRQPGVLFCREDGSTAAFLGDLNPTTPPYKQAWQQFDRLGNVIIADDTNSGKGLARPYVGGGIAWADTNITTWPATTNASWTSIATGNYVVLNAKVQFDVWVQADASTTGQIRVTVNGTQIGSTKTVTGAFDTLSGSHLSLPAGVNIGDKVAVSIDAQRTAGTGGVRAAPLWFAGDQS